ncbi:uncharacterized [Tachysurus ichikawai]
MAAFQLQTITELMPSSQTFVESPGGNPNGQTREHFVVEAPLIPANDHLLIVRFSNVLETEATAAVVNKAKKQSALPNGSPKMLMQGREHGVGTRCLAIMQQKED